MSDTKQTPSQAADKQKGDQRAGVSAESIVNLADENNKLRNLTKVREGVHAARYLIVIGVLATIILFLLWLQFKHFPQAKFTATQNAAAICGIGTLDKPMVTDATVKDFAKEAVVNIYSMDYANFNKTLAIAANAYLLPEFTPKFVESFNNSSFLTQVIESRFVVVATGTPSYPPAIAQRGLIGGVYSWKVRVPITFTYSSGRQTHEDHAMAVVTVRQADPAKVPSATRGIGVQWMDLVSAGR
ncbi:DotI/IcmL family type IV secretion protein [Pandoraea communis]|uniref:DotI/IcmL family type IV secretion protein n=1 Tax=Pandoraea communis TaxID=2508297 RepID=UPI0025A5DB09|nr:DotI/IcmL family type IV secretion protein [Pandoraea communis]MDM8356509.1 DotI/IcmL family type IV secretion protein [Pandoraea communis]